MMRLIVDAVAFRLRLDEERTVFVRLMFLKRSGQTTDDSFALCGAGGGVIARAPVA